MRALLLAVLLLAAAPVAASALPIADPLPTTLPHATGGPATPAPFPRTVAPQNPFMAPNRDSNLHDDTWMTDADYRPGPLGRNLEATSGAMPSALCGSLTFDSSGRIVTVCPSIVQPITARIIDPETLTIRASYVLGPPNEAGPGAY
jgi:hypothetical protein